MTVEDNISTTGLNITNTGLPTVTIYKICFVVFAPYMVNDNFSGSLAFHRHPVLCLSAVTAMNGAMCKWWILCSEWELRWVNQVRLYTSQSAWKPTWNFPLQLQVGLIELCEGYTYIHTQAESVCAKVVWWDMFKLCFVMILHLPFYTVFCKCGLKVEILFNNDLGMPE